MHRAGRTLINQHPTLHGALRINVSPGLGRQRLAAAVSSFAQLHPKLTISLDITPQPLSLLENQSDLCICVGKPNDSRLIGVRLLENPNILCGSPEYLEAMPAIKEVSDLAQHECLALVEGGGKFATWRFQKLGKEFPYKARNRLLSNDSDVVLQLALAGHGLILCSRWEVQEHLSNKSLQPVLGDFVAPSADIFAVFKHQPRIPEQILIFTQHLIEELQHHPRPPKSERSDNQS
jgi:DNA-binding transcriptional LysR family regulator